MASVTYQISGLSCGKCVAKVTEALRPHAGDVAVTLDPPRAILHEPRSDLAQLNAATAAVGHYSLGPVKAENPIAVWAKTYKPLLLIVGYIAVGSLAGAGAESLHIWMLNFMAGFFLVFSFFKFLNLKGFAKAYASYDLLAAKSRAYALAYPFIELALGLAYLFRIQLQPVLVITAILMAFGSIGVIAALRRGQAIQCACLGTTLNLPMSTVTIVEDLGMAAMALVMLVII